MAEGSPRYPGYDVLSKYGGPSWNEATRRVVDKRLATADEPRFLDAFAYATLKALCGRILPQPADRPSAPLAAYVDRKLAEDARDGYRYADMPPLREAWRQGLAALDAEARAAHDRPFVALGPDQQDALVAAMQAGELTHPDWGEMAAKNFFENRAAPDIVRAYYAHPYAWNEIGFGGPASPRGYVRLESDRRDPWEAAEAKPGGRARAARANARVR
jgi:hypothetical protein